MEAQQRKELLRPSINSREREEVLAFLQRYRLVNPDPQIAEGFSSLLEKYPYLKDHLADLSPPLRRLRA